MTEKPNLNNKPERKNPIDSKKSNKSDEHKSRQYQTNSSSDSSDDIVKEMENRIKSFKTGLSEYQIKEMVNDTEKLGSKLAKNLKTNQVRKFLDAVNRLKAQPEKEKDFEQIKSGVQLLRPQLAYAAARQKAAVDLQLVMEAAINQIKGPEDFTRFVQLTESIIAYHKAAGGKD